MKELAMKELAVSTESIFWDDSPKKRSQMRQSGIVPGHVEDLISSIANIGQLEPVTLEPILGKGEPQYRCVDGNHRCTAIREINLRREKNDLEPLSVKAVVLSFKDNVSRIIEQIKKNDHPPALSSTKKDLIVNFTQIIKEENACGNLSGLHPTATKKVVKEYISSIIPGNKDVNKITNQVFNSLPSDITRVENYTKTRAIEWFNDHNTETSATERITQSGCEAAGAYWYFGNSLKNIPTCHGNAHRKCVVHEDYEERNYPFKAHIVAWDGECLGKEASGIVDYREEFVKRIREINSRSTFDVFSKVFFLPQILEGCHGTTQPDDSVLPIEVDVSCPRKKEGE